MLLEHVEIPVSRQQRRVMMESDRGDHGVSGRDLPAGGTGEPMERRCPEEHLPGGFQVRQTGQEAPDLLAVAGIADTLEHLLEYGTAGGGVRRLAQQVPDPRVGGGRWTDLQAVDPGRRVNQDHAGRGARP